jgi:hypothetical protein
VIRQAISCDICASEKKQTNHWFVAYEQAGELRVSGWNSRNRQRPGAKHLCGQTCLHKLVDDFMARTLVKSPAIGETAEQEMEANFVQPAVPQMNDTSLAAPARGYARSGTPSRTRTEMPSRTRTETPNYARTETPSYAEAEASLDEFESSARLIPSPAAAAAPASPLHRVPAELVRMPGRSMNEERAAVPAEAPRYSSRNWRSEAWERERERELRAAARMRSNG